MIRDQELAGLAMTLGRDNKITITVAGDSSFCTADGSHINIARMPATPLGRMLMTGLVFHEVGHKNYTTGGRSNDAIGAMMNVIEDVRVDLKTVQERPGTCFNLEAITTHFMKDGCLKPKHPVEALLGKVLAFGYGWILGHKTIVPLEGICDELLDESFGEEFKGSVASIIKEIPRLKDTGESTVMARKLIDLIIQHIPPHFREDSRMRFRAGKFPLRHKHRGGITITPEEIEQLLNDKTDYGDFSRLIRLKLDALAAAHDDHERQKVPLLPQIGRMQMSLAKLDEVEALSASSRMRSRLMGLLQSRKRQPIAYGLSGRKVVSSRLVRLTAGDPRIFRKKVEQFAMNTAVTVLLDLSGSMNGIYTVANAAAFALHTALFGLEGVAVCSLEFSGKKDQPEVNVLVDFGKKPLSEMFNHLPYDGTPTDRAIWAARALLLQRHELRKIMLILTDGCPNNSSETKTATKRAMKDGIEMAAIGIIDNSVERYWDNHRVIKSIKELPSAMFGVMENLLMKRC